MQKYFKWKKTKQSIFIQLCVAKKLLIETFFKIYLPTSFRDDVVPMYNSKHSLTTSAICGQSNGIDKIYILTRFAILAVSIKTKLAILELNLTLKSIRAIGYSDTQKYINLDTLWENKRRDVLCKIKTSIMTRPWKFTLTERKNIMEKSHRVSFSTKWFMYFNLTRMDAHKILITT